MAIYEINSLAPTIHDTVFVAEDSTVIGQVILSENASVWPQAVIRGDNESISIGRNSNVQEGAVLHTDPGFPIVVGENFTIGHQVMLHGCTIGEGSLIGIQSVILNGAIIGKNCIVGAGAVVTQGKVFPDNSLILSSPAKVIKELDANAAAQLKCNADDYVARAKTYISGLKRIS